MNYLGKSMNTLIYLIQVLLALVFVVSFGMTLSMSLATYLGLYHTDPTYLCNTAYVCIATFLSLWIQNMYYVHKYSKKGW